MRECCGDVVVRRTGLVWVLFMVVVTNFLLLFDSVSAESQQHFRVRPQSTQVIEGQTVELKCEVSERSGRVQWSKDGFVLGFNRSIPGYPRFSMTGEESLGEYNLRIVNATLEENGSYQCQVGPKDGHKAIWSDANLTVLVPPKTLEIESYLNGSIVDLRERETKSLTCVAGKAKPPPRIKWFRKNIELRLDNIQTVEGESDNGRRSVTSTFPLTPQADDNDITYSCQAEHEALSAPLRTSITLSVQFPPGPPEIYGYQEGDSIKNGTAITLRCTSRGGNPLARLEWFRNNEEKRLDGSYTTSGRESTNTHTFVVTPADNNAVYKCIASSMALSESLVKAVRLTVQFAPNQVTVTGPKEAKAGDTVTLKCRTERSNPAVTLSWVVDGRPEEATSTKNIEDPQGGFITISEVSVNITGQENNLKMFTCYAHHGGMSQTTVGSEAVRILSPPESIDIQGYTEGRPILKGSLHFMMCIVRGGNPTPTVKWYKGTDEKKSSTQVVNESVTSKLSIIASEEENGAEYRCEASNSATSKPLEKKTRLTVYFPPSRVVIKLEPKIPRAGYPASFICESASSNPESILSWWKNGLPLPSTTEAPIDAPFGGKSNRAIYKTNITEEDHNATYTCQATNRVWQESVHDTITISVQYKPKFSELKYPITLKEGESRPVTVVAQANPADVKFTWTKGDQIVATSKFPSERSGESSQSRVYANDSTLNLIQVTRHDAGNYSCEATNQEGSARTFVSVIVQYHPIVKTRSETKMVSPGVTASFDCEIDSIPQSEITWKKDNEDVGRTKIDQHLSNLSTYKIYNVTSSDTGEVICTANNMIGDEATQKHYLIVKSAPTMVREAEHLKAAGEEGQEAQLHCFSDGAPDITFKWTREGQPLQNGSKYQITSRKMPDHLIRWSSLLMVSDISSSDYSLYDCIARNEMGSDKVSIELVTYGSPDKLIDLRVINSTYNSVTLSWKPGFDGGFPQSFHIRYKKVDSDEGPRYQDVLPSNATNATIYGLELDTEYEFDILAFNERGRGKFMGYIVKGRTTDEAPPTVAADILPTAKVDIPKIIITTVSIVGSSLLLLNIVLVICFVRKRRKKRLEEEESDQSSKAATIEMYAPSSYNETMNGETVSSTSEKSEAYSNEHSAQYSEEPSKPAATTYLIEQESENYIPDGSLHYSPYRYSDEVVPAGNGSIDQRIIPNRHVRYEAEDDYYADALRRNAYNQKLGEKTGYGKVPGAPPPPPGRTAASGVDAIYNINSDPRYVPFPPGNVAVHADPNMTPVLSTFSPSAQNSSVPPVMTALHNFGSPVMDGMVVREEMDGHLV